MTIIIPTRNEASNVAALVGRIEDALASASFCWEVQFVDDSDDGLPAEVACLASRGLRVHAIRRRASERIGGLAGAVAVGFRQATSDVYVVMDGDLQHPPELLPDLIDEVANGAQIAIATRYAADGSDRSGLAGRYRRWVSNGSRYLVRSMFPEVRAISDPLSGYFALRRDVVAAVELRPDGFKILLEILIRGRWSVATELSYRFGHRLMGESKATWREGVRFVHHLALLRTPFGGRRAPEPLSPISLVRSRVEGSQSQPRRCVHG